MVMTLDANDYRNQGRSEAIVLVLVNMGRDFPWLTLAQLEGYVHVSDQEVKDAIERLRIDHLRAQILERGRPQKRRRTRALPDVHCQYCGKVVPRENRTGHPRTICNPPCSESKNR
jgi:hypothetical protein